jgi:amino acid adenylation domain-containing protein
MSSDEAAERDGEGAAGLCLPADRPRTPGARSQRAERPLALPDELAAELGGRAERAAGAEAVWLAAVAALGHRYTQQRSFALEVLRDAGGGARTECRRLMLRVDGSRPAAELLDQAGEALGAADGPTTAPDPDVPAVALGFFRTDAALDAYREAAEGRDRHELRLLFAGGAPRAIVFDANLFLPATIDRLAGHLRELLAALLREPGCPVSRLPLMTAAEREQILTGWRSPRVARPEKPLHDYVRANAAARPDAIAVTFRGAGLSYGELERRSNRLARGLIERGCGRGTRVAVCIQPSADIAVCILGIFKAGATHVPLDPSYPRDRLAVILDDVRPAVVLSQAAVAGVLPPVEAPIVLLDREQEASAGGADEPPDVRVGLEDPAFIVYTSGTTGKPKGVVMTHGNLVHYVLSARDQYGLTPAEVVPAAARFTFSITLFEVLLPLVAGGRVIVLERDHLLDLSRLVATLKEATLVHASPALWRKVLAYLADQRLGPEGFRNLRHVSSGGDLVSADLVESLKRAFDRAEVYVIYGCSEIACMGCTHFVARDRAATTTLVGKPFENTTVRLCDPEGNLVPIGVVGEILFAGAGVSAGYLNRAELTAERFSTIDGERFYRTGDLGRYDADGNVEILGRTDFQIKLRGIRIELGDVESTLRQAPGVKEAVATARDLGGSEKALVAYLVPAAGEPDLPAIRRFLQAKLPDYMVPAAFVVLRALPVNLNNKLDRGALPAPTAGDLARLRTFDPPATEAERRLAAIWERVLGVRPIGVRDSFFDIGGDSLQSVTLMVEVEKAFGTALPLSTILTDPTVEKMAALLGAGAGDPRNPVVLLRPGAGGPPVFFVHDGEGEVIPYRNLALRLSPAHAVYGIQPVGRRGHPMLHTRIADIVDDYARLIREIQPEGPYVLSGLCVGGFIAFEIARKLKREGQRVGSVILLDAAHVTAEGKSVARRRLRSLSAAMSPGGPRAPLHRVALARARTLATRAANVARYELRNRLTRQRNLLKMRLFRFCLDRSLPLPRVTQDLSVDVVLRFAEKEYVTPARPYEGELALLKATRKDPLFDGTLVDDTPYVDLFADPELGWRGKATAFESHEMPGGHSSMLVPPHVEILAMRFQGTIDRALGRAEPARQHAA